MTEIKIISADSDNWADIQTRFKHAFVRSFKPIPNRSPNSYDCILDKLSEKDRHLLSALAGQTFREMFPEIAEAIKTAMAGEGSPLFIDRFPLGYQKKPRAKKRMADSKEPEELKFPYTLQADNLLAMAVVDTMGFQFYAPFSIGVANRSTGREDTPHTHPGWAVVVGVVGVGGVNTRLFEGVPSGYDYFLSSVPPSQISRDFELHRGSVLLIPPKMYHSVDGFEGGEIVLTDKGGKVLIDKNDRDLSFTRTRVTQAYFPFVRAVAFTSHEMEEAAKQFMRDPKEVVEWQRSR